jgi:hypothetical protein
MLLTGCSPLFITAPPPKSERVAGVEPKCTTSNAAPAIDTVIAGLQAIRTIVAVAADDSDYSNLPISRPADIGLGSLLTVAFAAAAGYGFSTTSSCEEAKQDFRERPIPRENVYVIPISKPRARVRAPAPFGPECTFDAQCSNARVCENGHCVNYDPAMAP